VNEVLSLCVKFYVICLSADGLRHVRLKFFQADVSMKATRNRLPHARLNYAENLLLSHCNARSTSKIAIHSVIEGTVIRSLTWAELYDEVRSASRAMRNLGLCPGDRVAAYTANNAEAVIMILAASAIGAIWSATPCEFGVIATLDRLEQV
jgi:acetoacetyl-CoA synthetase